MQSIVLILAVLALGAKPDLTVKPEKFMEKVSRTRTWTRRTNPLFTLEAEGVDDIHLAYAGEGAPVLVLSNRTDSARTLTGGITLSAIGGCETNAFAVSGEFPAHGVRRFPIGRELAKGVWMAVADLETSDARAIAETRFAIVRRRTVTPPSASGVFRAGFNYHMARYTDEDNEKCLRALVQSGAKFVRANIGAKLTAVEPKESSRDWTKPDRYLALLERNGLALDTIVYGAPDWAIDEKHRGALHMKGRWFAPMRRGLFREFCHELAARYGTRIAWYEIGNEWDLLLPELMTADEAIEMQREGYEGVKAGCPDAKVIPNGWAVVHSDVIPHRTQRGMQERMMVEAADCCDAHTVHQHGPYREYHRRLVEFFAWRKAKGIGNRPWYSNETAQTTGNVGEDRVAECVWQKILHAWAHGSVDYIWYNLRAIGYGPYDGEQGYGVMTGDFYPRATYAAFAGLTSCFEGLKPAGIVHEGVSRDLYRFAGAGRMVLVGWDLRAKADSMVRIRTDATRAFVADLFDNRREVPVREGTVFFGFGRTPRALILENATAASPDEEDLRRGEEPEIAEIELGPDGHRFKLEDYDSVFEMYKADPQYLDRVWKGWNDLVGTIRIRRADDRLEVMAETRDEKLAEGDRLVVIVGETGTRFPVKAPKNHGARYAGSVALPPGDAVLEIRIEDDDGFGKEGWITTGKFRIGCVKGL